MIESHYPIIYATAIEPLPLQSRLPSARRVSVSVLKTERGSREEAKNRHNMILLAFWGQFVDHDIRLGNVSYKQSRTIFPITKWVSIV